jgi:NADPH:quinone reductase-like Zn-dependent oxidoreductase
LIKVASSSVNPVDWKILSGMMGPTAPIDNIPGFDCSGVVVAVGSAVTRFKAGDEVWADVVDRNDAGLKLGAYAEYVATKEFKTGLKPTNLSFDQAAVVPLVGLTALQGLQKGMVLQEGASVLILGGSGGNGICAIQIAKAHGATVYTTCSGKNVDFVKGLGADEVIDYTKDDWSEVLKGKNLDSVFDTVGQEGTVQKAVDVVKDNGKIVAIMGGSKEPLPRGITFEFFLTNSKNVPDLDTLKTLVEADKLSLPIQETFPLDKIPDAFKLNMSGRVVGKICIKVS